MIYFLFIVSPPTCSRTIRWTSCPPFLPNRCAERPSHPCRRVAPLCNFARDAVHGIDGGTDSCRYFFSTPNDLAIIAVMHDMELR